MAKPVSTQPPSFVFHHGRLALSFVGTVGDRGSVKTERLGKPKMLGAWMREARLTVEGTVPAATVYRRALGLREAVARAVQAVVAGSFPADADVALINEVARRWAPRPYLNSRTLTREDKARDPAEGALGRVAVDAIELLGNAEERSRLRACALDTCAALFLAPPGRRERRWCSMARCGNRAKVTAFRAREAQPDAPQVS